jgi:hypothetical protein
MTVADKQIQIVTCGGVVGVILSGQIPESPPPVSATTETGPLRRVSTLLNDPR